MKKTLLALFPLVLACGTDKVGDPLPMDPVDPTLPGSWSAGPPLPQALHSVGAAVYRDHIYVVGGIVEIDAVPTAQRTVYRLDPDAGQWETLPLYPAPRGNVQLVVLNDVLYGVGGRATTESGLSVGTDEVWAFDPDARSWSLATRLPVPLQGHVAKPAGGEIMVLGGRNESQLLQISLFYDPAAGTWRNGGAFPQPRFDPGAAADERRVWILGGSTVSDMQSRADAYDFVDDEWYFFQGMPRARDSFGATILDGRVHAIGGTSEADLATSHLVLDVATNAWGLFRALPRPLTETAAVTWGDVIYVLGGRDGTTVVSDVYIFTD